MDEMQKAIESLSTRGLEISGKARRVAEFYDALDTAINAMQELQQYREIGTLEDIQRVMENPISALQELFQYRKIGTLNECEEARRKQETMMISCNVAGQYNCPECGERISTQSKYCGKCGQSVKCIKQGWQRYET